MRVAEGNGEAARKGPREAEAAKERPFFTESNKGLGIAAPRNTTNAGKARLVSRTRNKSAGSSAAIPLIIEA